MPGNDHSLHETLPVLDPINGFEDETVSIDYVQLGIVHQSLICEPLEGNWDSGERELLTKRFPSYIFH